MIPTKLKSGPKSKKTSTRTHEEEQEEEEDKVPLSLSQRRCVVQADIRILVGSFAAGSVKCTVVPVHFLWVVVEKRCLGWYMRGVGFVLGAGGGFLGAGPF